MELNTKGAPIVGGILALALAVQASAESQPFAIEHIKKQVQGLEAGEQMATSDAGRPSFRLGTVEGYPGDKTSIKIADKYRIFEDGLRREKSIHKVQIDWGDGDSSTSFAGAVQNHQYGERIDTESETSITPNRNTRYEGRITFLTTDGKRYTEKFHYEVWVDRRGSLARGGRRLPNEVIEPVWCVSGTLSDSGVCNESFEIEQVVFEYEGCFDHNRVQFPVLYAPETVFDVRGSANIVGGRYNDGWAATAGTNEIAGAYGNGFRVYNHRGTNNNMSGIYYKFNPINPAPAESGTTVKDVTITSVHIAEKSLSVSRHSGLSRGIYRQPSQGNGWRGVYRLEDPGVGGGTTPCPKGTTASTHAWAKLSISATVKGRVSSVRATSAEPNLPSGYHHNPNYEAYMNDPNGGG